MYQLLQRFTDFVMRFLTVRRSLILASASTISNSERIVAFLLFAIFAAAFCHFQLVTAFFHQLDTAFLMETLASIKKTGIPTTYLGPSFIDAYSTFHLNAESLCNADLIPSGRSLSVFTSHAYYILYPLAALTWLFPPDVILAVANGLSFASVIFIVYWAIRKQGVPILAAIAFCLLVIAHPAWSHAQLGNFYADRFFMPLGLLYISLLYGLITRKADMNRSYWVLLLVVGLFAAATSERAAIMIALFTIASLVIFRKEMGNRVTRIMLALFSVALLLHVFIYMKFYKS